ncbi:hypothetical protein THAOC_20542, partial [Thalassiosira oceanica]
TASEAQGENLCHCLFDTPPICPEDLPACRVAASDGICIFFSSDQQDEWGPSLESHDWIYQGLPAGFGYPNQLALYCQYETGANAADIQLPPFHDFSDDALGIHHGICTFGNVQADPTSPDSSLTYDRVVLSSSAPTQMWGETVNNLIIPENFPEESAVNLALDKTATQSSTVAGGDASRAVDGNTNGDYGGNSVTHTENNPLTPPEWEVDLQFPSVIRTIIVYNRVDYRPYYLVGAVVSLHRQNSGGEWEMLKEAVDQPLTSDAIQTIDFTDDVYVATGVRIRLPNPGVLSLAEVQVMGFVMGQVYGFESTPCQTFYRSSRISAPHDAVTTLSVTTQVIPDSAICVMSVDKHWIPSVVSWQESLESEEYGFTPLELSQGLYIRINAGDSVGHTYNLAMHCKNNAASATLPPVPEGDDRTLELGLCVYGNEVLSAAATIAGNSFSAISAASRAEPWRFYANNPRACAVRGTNSWQVGEFVPERTPWCGEFVPQGIK